MTKLKSLSGNGTVKYAGTTIAVRYAIEVHQTTKGLRADGVFYDLNPSEIMSFQTQPDLTLTLDTGESVEIVALSGSLIGPLKFAVNSRLSGF